MDSKNAITPESLVPWRRPKGLQTLGMRSHSSPDKNELESFLVLLTIEVASPYWHYIDVFFSLKKDLLKVALFLVGVGEILAHFDIFFLPKANS